MGLDNWASRPCRLGKKMDTFVLIMTKLCVEMDFEINSAKMGNQSHLRQI